MWERHGNTSHVGCKRSRILDAAQSLFLRYGVKRTSLDDVVREAGIAKGTLYLYFNFKDALFAAIAERLCVEMLRYAEEAIVTSSSRHNPLILRN
jgi:AcrR family transcriptional regulator